MALVVGRREGHLSRRKQSFFDLKANRDQSIKGNVTSSQGLDVARNALFHQVTSDVYYTGPGDGGLRSAWAASEPAFCLVRSSKEQMGLVWRKISCCDARVK